ncbi:hypothetical protein BMMON2_42940 [Burkholderia mallei]
MTSLRRTLLRRLAAPLSMLALMSGLIAYWLAWQYTQHVVDRSLADLASAISKQIQIAGPTRRSRCRRSHRRCSPIRPSN